MLLLRVNSEEGGRWEVNMSGSNGPLPSARSARFHSGYLEEIKTPYLSQYPSTHLR